MLLAKLSVISVKLALLLLAVIRVLLLKCL
jgi:hypothetical protein